MTKLAIFRLFSVFFCRLPANALVYLLLLLEFKALKHILRWGHPMAAYDIDGENKNIVGIGKMIIDTNSVSWNIPHLHFLVLHEAVHFEAVCLEFGLVSSGVTQEEAAERLIEHTIYHIGTAISEGNGFGEFKEVALNGFMNNYWGAYRHIEFCLAETKRDLSHEIESRITRALQELFDKKVKELIAVRAKEAADEAIREYEKMIAFKINSVRYSQLAEAAA
jgi:hypothetical protein